MGCPIIMADALCPLLEFAWVMFFNTSVSLVRLPFVRSSSHLEYKPPQAAIVRCTACGCLILVLLIEAKWTGKVA